MAHFYKALLRCMPLGVDEAIKALRKQKLRLRTVVIVGDPHQSDPMSLIGGDERMRAVLEESLFEALEKRHVRQFWLQVRFKHGLRSQYVMICGL